MWCLFWMRWFKQILIDKTTFYRCCVGCSLLWTRKTWALPFPPLCRCFRTTSTVLILFIVSISSPVLPQHDALILMRTSEYHCSNKDVNDTNTNWRLAAIGETKAHLAEAKDQSKHQMMLPCCLPSPCRGERGLRLRVVKLFDQKDWGAWKCVFSWFSIVEGTAAAFSMSKYSIQVDIISKCYMDLLGLKRSLLFEAANMTIKDLKFVAVLIKYVFIIKYYTGRQKFLHFILYSGCFPICESACLYSLSLTFKKWKYHLKNIILCENQSASLL